MRKDEVKKDVFIKKYLENRLDKERWLLLRYEVDLPTLQRFNGGMMHLVLSGLKRWAWR